MKKRVCSHRPICYCYEERVDWTSLTIASLVVISISLFWLGVYLLFF